MTIKHLRQTLNDADSLISELEDLIDPKSKVVHRNQEEMIGEAIITLSRLVSIIEDFGIE